MPPSSGPIVSAPFGATMPLPVVAAVTVVELVWVMPASSSKLGPLLEEGAGLSDDVCEAYCLSPVLRTDCTKVASLSATALSVLARARTCLARSERTTLSAGRRGVEESSVILLDVLVALPAGELSPADDAMLS